MMDGPWFVAALERAGVSQADLARHLRLAPSAISRMLKGERQMKIAEAVEVAAFLGVSQEEVLRHAGAGQETAPRPPLIPGVPARRGRPPRSPHAMPAPSRADPIPIRTIKRGSAGAEPNIEDLPIGYTPRPTNLMGVRGAYAIYMVGDEMEPRYEQGWLLHVNPFKPPTRGRDVVVYRNDQTVLIRHFVGWDGDALVLRQLNPARELRVPRGEVTECHLVVGVDQEG